MPRASRSWAICSPAGRWAAWLRSSANTGASGRRANARISLAHDFDPLLQHLVPPLPHTLQRLRCGDGRQDADAVVLRSIVLEHLHPRPRERIAAGKLERVDVAVRA